MKSKVAFQLTASGLFGPYAKVYFWTFTFHVTQTDWVAAELFRRFLWDLRREVDKPGWGGVRVVELHKEHGVHYHALINCRLGVDLVRRVAGRHAIGRVHVEHCNQDAAGYLSKYLSKQREGPLTKTGRNARRWACFGDLRRVRISDLINDSPMWRYRREENLPWLGINAERLLWVCWIRGEECFKSAWFAGKRAGKRAAEAVIEFAEGWVESSGALHVRESIRSVYRRSAALDVRPF